MSLSDLFSEDAQKQIPELQSCKFSIFFPFPCMQLIIFISNLLKLAQIINNTTLARLYLQCRMLAHHSSSRLAWWKHMTVQTNTRKEKNSIHIAPFPIRSACLRIIGMAMLPTADAPVKNLAASIQLQLKKWKFMRQMM